MFGYGQRIADARAIKGWSQSDLARKVGTTQQQIARYESGENDVKSSIILKLSAALGVTVSFLLGLDDSPTGEGGARISPIPVEASLPLVGSIAAGTPREALELGGDRAWASPSVVERHPNAFFLRVSGDSMNLMFPDGCLVAIDPDDCALKSGKVYAVLVNGCDATLKQVYRAGDTIVLHPVSSNPEHRDRAIDVNDPDAPYFRIVGRAVWFQADACW